MPFDNEFDTQLNFSPNEYISSPNNNIFLNEYFELPSDITMDDIKFFQKIHDDYSIKLHQSFLKFQYDIIEKLIQQFWALTNIHSSQINDLINNGRDKGCTAPETEIERGISLV
jgi:hypothetical protein